MKYYLVPVAILIMSTNTWSEDFEQNHLDRLFTTPQQRQKMDSIRYSEAMAAEQKMPQESKVNEDSKTLSLNSLYFRGVVKSQNGDRILWINNHNSMEAHFPDERIEISNTSDFRHVEILLPNGDVMPLQVGDKIEFQDTKDN